MTGIRALVRLARIGAALLLCLLPHGVLRLLGRPSPWPRRFLALTAHAAGLDLRVEGAAPGGRALIVANHRSWLDIPVLAAASGCAFVSKAEVGRWPVVGWLARLNRTVFVERARRGDARGQADALRAALAAGQAVALFPEGRTSADPGLLPFKPSLFASVVPPPPGVAVRPVLIDYGAAGGFVSWPDGEGTVANARRILGRGGRIPVVVRFLPPVDAVEAGDRKRLAAACQRALEDAAVSR